MQTCERPICMEYRSPRGWYRPWAKRASSGSMPMRGTKMCPAQKKNIHNIHAKYALRNEWVDGFTGWRVGVETEIVPNVETRGLRREISEANPGSSAFGTKIAQEGSRADVAGA